MKRKLVVGWFSFTCSEDNTVMLLEMLNDDFFAWKDRIEFRHCRILKSKNELKGLDVAFVEGAISTRKELEEVKEIRKNCRKLVAVGACAVFGRPSSQRNDFDAKGKQEINFLLKRFDHLDKVLPVKDAVKVDDSIPGCPISPDKLREALEKYIKEFTT